MPTLSILPTLHVSAELLRLWVDPLCSWPLLGLCGARTRRQSRDPSRSVECRCQRWCRWLAAPTSSAPTISGVTKNPPQVSEPLLQGFGSLHKRMNAGLVSSPVFAFLISVVCGMTLGRCVTAGFSQGA